MHDDPNAGYNRVCLCNLFMWYIWLVSIDVDKRKVINVEITCLSKIWCRTHTHNICKRRYTDIRHTYKHTTNDSVPGNSENEPAEMVSIK